MTRLAAWNFNEASGNVIDVSGFGNDFALSGNTVRTASGKYGNGLTQTAADTLALSSAVLSPLKTPRRSICAWIKETSPVIGWVGEFYISAIDSGGWGILFLSGNWNVQARNASGLVRASIPRPTDSQFHHIAGTYDESNVKLYLDGVLAATQPLTAPLRTDADSLRLLDGSSSAITVDDLQYFDTALSPAEVVAAMDPVVPGRSGKPKVWNGSAWVSRQAKVWDGSTWKNAKMSAHNGTDWVTAK